MAWVIAVMLVLTVMGVGLWWWLFRYSLPQVSGTVRVAGLGDPVTITRDRWGVPHIAGQSLADCAYGLGYAHAQDRLWQMELQRRVGAGRLAESVGPEMLETDRFLRRLGLRRAAEAEAAQLDESERAFTEAYCRGVNAFGDKMGGRLPLEFRLLGLKFEPWTPVDVLAWGKVMALSLVHNWEDELLRYQLAEHVGPELAARLEPDYTPGMPLTTQPIGPGAADSAAELLRLFEAARPYLITPGGASNNWVVAGNRTATGKPLLANDPHLVLSMPSTWYEAHLTCPEMDVTGATLPGVPGVVIGHNAHVAWGFTDAFADTADLFIEKWHPTQAACEFQGQWEPAEVRQEIIKVKGKPDEVETVYVTRHGPVLAGGPLGPGPALALRWVALDPGHSMRAIRGLNAAHSAVEVREALRDWPAPALNMVFADMDGNIGYLMCGSVPIRKSGTGLTPVPGWTGEHEWTGWIPFEELPQIMNPDSGFIATANNKVVDHTYRHHISWDYMPGYRAARILQRLKTTEGLTVQDCAEIQVDVYSIPGEEFATHCRDLKPDDPLEQKALKALLSWDGYLRPGSVGGAVYEAMADAALRRAYGPAMGDELMGYWLGKAYHGLAQANARVGRATTALLRDLRKRESGFPLGPTATGVDRAADCDGAELWRCLLSHALTDAVAYLRRTLGDDPSHWQWGQLHRLKFGHPMSAIKLLRPIFKRVDLPIGGDMSTPCQTAFVPHAPFTASAWAPSYRQVVDFADLEASVCVLPGGQSGQPGSRHYLDLLPLWHQGELHPMIFGQGAVLANAESVLRLEPEA
ncbi:MAG TPA: penicillin acylase family protein [Symbiobacteriaceae bacterium]